MNDFPIIPRQMRKHQQQNMVSGLLLFALHILMFSAAAHLSENIYPLLHEQVLCHCNFVLYAVVNTVCIYRPQPFFNDISEQVGNKVSGVCTN